MSNYRRRYHRREASYGYGVPKINHPQLPPQVPHRHRHDTGSCSWQPLPAWEKRFCEEVGAMPWQRFVKAKKNLHETDKVFDWNDSAGLMAFKEAKQRFWAKHHGFLCKNRLPSPDMYIDKHIDWNPKIDPNILSEMKSISDDEEEEEVEVAKEIDWFSIPLDQIKPTGWEVDDCDYTPQLPKVVG